MSAFADTVIEQLGGRKIFAMAFKSAAHDDRRQRVTLHIAKSLQRAVGASHVVIMLEPSDTYTVQFWQTVQGIGFKQRVIKQLQDVYAEQLPEVVERMTGLRLSL